jgi:hypothetical protein
MGSISMHCKNCGQLLNPSSEHCKKCGKTVKEDIMNKGFVEESKSFKYYIRKKGKRYIKYFTPIVFISLFFYGYWELVNHLYQSVVFEQKGNHQFSGGDILTVVFGLSSSILTLVGLITIFVSINSQHRIQRCREVLWELIGLPYQCWNDRGGFDYKFSIEQSIRQRLIIYQQTLKSGVFFNHLIVIYLFVVILIVSGIIIITIQALKDFYFTNMGEYQIIFSAVTIGVTIMITFAVLILSLARISLIASLPQLSDIMNTNTQKSDIPSILLAAMCMRVFPTNQLIARFTFPFQNLEIYPWIIGTLKDTNKEVLIKGAPFEENLNKTHLKNYYVDHTRAHRMHYVVMNDFDVNLYKKVSYKFELSSKQGKVYVEFEQDIKSSLKNEGRLHPINIVPKLKIENELFKHLDF